MPDLRLHALTKSYGSVEALRGIDLEVGDGEFFVLFGPSAAGKTTTLRIIAGLEKPDDGTLTVDGRDLAGVPVKRRDMAMVFQSFALYPHLTTFQNLAYPLREMKLRRAEIDARVGETAELLRITHTLKRRPASLSGGEQQRLAIGRAIIRRPRIFLFDEPLTNLDAKLRHDMRAEFKRLHREIGTTMIYATPDQLEALGIGERIAVIQNGRITQVDTAEELYGAPVDRHVASLIGDPPINLIKGTLAPVASDGPRIALPFIEFDARSWLNQLGGLPTGTELLVGIRPQDIRLVERGGAGIEAAVGLTEPQGDITVLDLVAAGTALRMVVPEAIGARYEPGDRIRITLEPTDARLFMGDSGMMVA
jgi:multiple sugar transport system ATP-binding protein